MEYISAENVCIYFFASSFLFPGNEIVESRQQRAKKDFEFLESQQ